MNTYEQDKAWKAINKFLPKEFQLTEANMPKEEFWEWKGNQIHLDRYPNPDAKYRIFLHHGVGTNGRQLSMIFGHKMAALGYDVVAVDNLGYGMTEVNQKDITYDDWVNMFVDFIRAETDRDPKKVILYGLSAGGMMAYHAAAIYKNVSGIIGMCFLNMRDSETLKTASIFRFVGQLAPLNLKILVGLSIKRLAIPMKWIGKMHTLVNDKKALKFFLKDKNSSGASVQIQFMKTWQEYQPALEPADFDICPILLTQPAEDKWTPLRLSRIALKDVKAPFTVKMLENGSHYPIEQPALNQLTQYADEFIQSLNK